MELTAPGADIVGFEYPAATPEEKAAVAHATNMLSQPLSLFVPSGLGCRVVGAKVEQDFQKQEGAGFPLALNGERPNGGVLHSEFHATYSLACDNLRNLGNWTFRYFDSFANAMNVRVQVIGDRGNAAFTVTRDHPTADLTSAVGS